MKLKTKEGKMKKIKKQTVYIKIGNYKRKLKCRTVFTNGISNWISDKRPVKKEKDYWIYKPE